MHNLRNLHNLHNPTWLHLLILNIRVISQQKQNLGAPPPSMLGTNFMVVLGEFIDATDATFLPDQRSLKYRSGKGWSHSPQLQRTNQPNLPNSKSNGPPVLLFLLLFLMLFSFFYFLESCFLLDIIQTFISIFAQVDFVTALHVVDNLPIWYNVGQTYNDEESNHFVKNNMFILQSLKISSQIWQIMCLSLAARE